MENRLVYESKGYKKGFIILVIAVAILCFGIGISDALSINAKSQGIQMMLDNRPITVGGGRDVYTKEGKQALLFSSLFFIVLSLVMVDVAIGLKKSWIKIYEDRLEGQVFTLNYIGKNILYLEKEQIQSVQRQGIALIINAGGKKNTFVCQDPNRALNAVNMLIRS